MKLQAIFATVALVLTACAMSSEPVGTDNGAGEAAKKKKVCVDKVMCMQGYVWSTRSCSCVPESHKCGNKVCGTNEYCCSESCGICERVGAMCPAIACP